MTATKSCLAGSDRRDVRSVSAANHDRTIRRAVTFVNAAGVVAAATFATTGLARPNYIDDQIATTPLTQFWAASSAVRSWAVATIFFGSIVRGPSPSAETLALAGLVQLGDSALGVWQHNRRMTIAPALMGAAHLASALLLIRRGCLPDRKR